MSQDKQANKHTQTIQKTILVNQVHPHSQPASSSGGAPSLKTLLILTLLQSLMRWHGVREEKEKTWKPPREYWQDYE